ncbi:MAG: DNA-processing protein DprA [Thermoanaerobacteraceae bacterium]|nr:DNA-processing protein DprA [Thermoanaerobacteraceae bacterium]
MDEAWIKLSLIPEISPQRFFNLIDYFGSAKEVFGADHEILKKILSLNDKVIDEIKKYNDQDIKFYINNLKANGIKLITYNDDEYPEALKNINDPPPVLYIKGNEEILNDMSLAIVGSRNCTYYGSQIAFDFSAQLAEIGFVIVSGMARGIDSQAHRGALSVNGKTIAVIGSGLDIIYPRENRELYTEIIQKGAVISEFPLGTEPLKQNFPRRNRIISGLSMGVLVVEAGEKSGSLITASFALEHGKEVFAIPGNINYESSKGTNKLIKDGAKLVASINDIIEEYELRSDLREKIENQKVNNLSEKYIRILEYVKNEPVNINSISNISGVRMNELIPILNSLTLAGYIKELPGKLFVKI